MCMEDSKGERKTVCVWRTVRERGRRCLHAASFNPSYSPTPCSMAGIMPQPLTVVPPVIMGMKGLAMTHDMVRGVSKRTTLHF